MKKVIYLLVLCMVLGMAGCGTNQENKEPVSGNVSVETENKENDDVVQNEQIADTGSSAENLAEDVQVGDIVTIWFNGMIQETYPAQLGVVYRIIKTQ